MMLGYPLPGDALGPREEKRRPHPGSLSGAKRRLSPGHCHLAIAGQGWQPQGVGNLPSQTGTSYQAKSTHSCRIGQCQVQGDEAAERVTNHSVALKLQSVEIAADKASEEGRRVFGGRFGTRVEARQIQCVDAVRAPRPVAPIANPELFRRGPAVAAAVAPLLPSDSE